MRLVVAGNRIAATVTLNGSQVFDCYIADEERGEVVCAARDHDGKLVRDGDKIKTEMLKGLVKITLRPR